MRIRAFAALAAVTSVLAGCGGGGEELTKTELADTLNKACLKFDSDTEDLTPLNGEADNDAKAIAERGDAAEAQLEAISDLTPPDDLQDAYDEFVSATEDALDGLEEAQEAAESGDQEEYERVITELNETVVEDGSAASEEIGADDCA